MTECKHPWGTGRAEWITAAGPGGVIIFHCPCGWVSKPTHVNEKLYDAMANLGCAFN